MLGLRREGVGTDWRSVWQAKGDHDGLSAREYDGFERTTVDPVQVGRAIAETVDLGPDDVVLEVGCGAGMVAAELTCRYVGVDYSLSLLRRHVGFARRPVLCGEAERLPLPDRAVDCALAYSVFHYFPDLGYAARSLGELQRVARRAVFVGDLPVASHDPDHLLFRPEAFPGWTVTPGVYAPSRFDISWRRT